MVRFGDYLNCAQIGNEFPGLSPSQGEGKRLEKESGGERNPIPFHSPAFLHPIPLGIRYIIVLDFQMTITSSFCAHPRYTFPREDRAELKLILEELCFISYRKNCLRTIKSVLCAKVQGTHGINYFLHCRKASGQQSPERSKNLHEPSNSTPIG